MKEDLCNIFKIKLRDSGLSFTEAATLCGISKTQINNIVNHKGKEVSLEKLIQTFKGLGYVVNFSVGSIDED